MSGADVGLIVSILSIWLISLSYMVKIGQQIGRIEQAVNDLSSRVRNLETTQCRPATRKEG